MAKRKSQGIGLIDSPREFKNLRITIINQLRSLEIRDGWDNAKKRIFIDWINASTGRSRGEETITDFYQVMFCTFLPAVHKIGVSRTVNNDFSYEEAAKKTNTLIAKLATEGQYGNTGVVRRQTTLAKLKQNLQQRSRVIVSEGALNSYERLSKLMGGLNRFDFDAGQGGTLFQVVDNVLNLRVGRGGRRASTTTRRASTTPTTTTTPRRSTTTSTTTSRTTDTDIARDITYRDVQADLRNFNEQANNGQMRMAFTQVAKAFRSAFAIVLRNMRLGSDNATIPLNTLQEVFSYVYSYRQGGTVDPTNYKTLKDHLRIIAFCLGNFKAPFAKDFSRVTLFPAGQRRQFTNFKLSVMTNNLFPSLSPTGVVNAVKEIVSGGASLSSPVTFNRFRGELINAVQNRGHFYLMPTVLRTTQALNLNSRSFTSPTQSEASSVTTSTPSASVSRTQVRNNATPTQSDRNQTRGDAMTTLVRDTKFKNTLGVELEYYGASFREMKEAFKKNKVKLYPRYLGYHEDADFDKFKEWRIMYDGSVKDRLGRYNSRDRDSGEIVSPILVGEKGLLSLIRVLNAMKVVGVTNNNSTGVHIHLGTKTASNPNGMPLKALRNFICNYIGFEGIIDAYIRPTRRQNMHSKYTPSPIVDIFPDKKVRKQNQDGSFEDTGEIKPLTYAEIKSLSDRLNAMTDDDFKSWARRTLNRGKINPHSNGLSFSFEVRHHGGTSEKDTLLGWIMFLHYLCELSKKKLSKSFTWNNLEKDILPKSLSAFWENRIVDMTGEIPDKFNGPKAR